MTPWSARSVGGACGVVALLAGGCAGDDPSGDAVPTSAPRLATTVLEDCIPAIPEGPVRLTLAHEEGGLRETALAAAVRSFEQAYPSVDVTLAAAPHGASSLMGAWADQSPAERPHVALLPHDMTGRLRDSGQTVAPGRCLRTVLPDLVPAIEAAWSVDGVVQAVPLSVSTPVLYTNRRAFAAAGLDPDDPPATLEDTRAAARRLVDTGAAEVGLMTDTSDTTGSWYVEQWAAQAGEPTLDPDNGRDGRATGVRWDGGPVAGRLAWLADMVEDGLATTVGVNPTGVADLYAAVEPDTWAGMLVHTSGSLGQVVRELPGLGLEDFELGVAPLPGPGPAPGSFAGGAALWMASGKPADEAAAAWLLAAHLAFPPVNEAFAAETGYVPLSASAGEREPLRSTWARYPEMAVAHEVLAGQGVDPVAVGPVTGPTPELHELLGAAVREVLAGRDPDDALRDAAEDAEQLLGAYARGRPGLRH